MTLRAQNVSGGFEKQAPELNLFLYSIFHDAGVVLPVACAPLLA